MPLDPEQRAAITTRVRRIVGGILFAIVVFIGWALQQADSGIEDQNAAERLHVFEAPLRLKANGVDHVLLLTGRWERVRVRNFRWSLYKRGSRVTCMWISGASMQPA